MRKSSLADNRAARGVSEEESAISKTVMGLAVIVLAAVIISAFKIRAKSS